MKRESGADSKTSARWGASAVLAAVVAMAVSPAVAQSTYPPAVENYCKEDYFRYCAPYSLGTDELRRCMEANGRTLSRNCQQALIDAGYAKTSRLRRGS